MPSEKIRSAMAVVRQVLLEVINFWSLPSIPKTSKPFEKLFELLLVIIFDAEVKSEIPDELVSFDEEILLEPLWMLDLMASDEIFCRLVMNDLIFPLDNQEEHPYKSVCNAEARGMLLYDIFSYEYKYF